MGNMHVHMYVYYPFDRTWIKIIFGCVANPYTVAICMVITQVCCHEGRMDDELTGSVEQLYNVHV